MINEINSLKDEKIQIARNLNTFKGRIGSGLFLIESQEALNWAIESGNIEIQYLLISNKNKNIAEKYNNFQIYLVSDGVLKKVTDTNYLIPLVAVAKKSMINKLTDFVLVLDDLKDYGNIGTIIRTSKAFGVESIINTNQDIDMYQKKTVDASRGKVFSVSFNSFQNPQETIKYLKDNNYQIITTSPYADRIQSLITLNKKPIALIVGNETEGVADEFIRNSDIIIQIPMKSDVESLNVGVATGISIYELKLKQVLAMLEKKIKSTLGREMNVTSMLVQSVLDTELNKLSEITSKQFIFMMVLKCDFEMSIKGIQKQFGILYDEIECFLKVLFDKNWIINTNLGALQITETGIETIAKLWSIIENAEATIFNDFSEDEKIELKRLIGKIQHNCMNLLNLPPESK
jgi:RNA methyltransferase, TrmH family